MDTSTKKISSSKIIYTSSGLYIEGSILWLDSSSEEAPLSFLSSVDQFNYSSTTKYITTEETAKLLNTKKKNINTLICQYNRPFSIGNLKMELLPSGSGLGSASLYIENDKNRILYAPYISLQKSSISRQFQLKKANTLVLGAFLSEQDCNLNRKKEKERLIDTINTYIKDDIYPIIACKSTFIAQYLIYFLNSNNIPVSVHPSIRNINKIYESFGISLGKYVPDSKYNKDKVKLVPFKACKTLPKDLPILYIKDSFDSLVDIKDTFFLDPFCTPKELKDIITTTLPKEVFVIGPYAKKYSSYLSSFHKEVFALYPNGQESLF